MADALKAAPPTALPGRRGRLLVAKAWPRYADDIVIALTRMVHTPSGRALFAGIAGSGHTLSIRPPAHTDPPNAIIQPLDLAAAAGTGSDVVIAFDAADWPNAAAPQLPTVDAALFVLFSQALPALRGTADPAAYAEASAVEAEALSLARYLGERGLAPTALEPP